MQLFHVEVQVVLSFKVLLANVAFVVSFENTFVAKLLQVFFQHSKIVESALVPILQHLNAIGFENRFHLRFYTVNHVLRMKPRAIVVLEWLP